MTTEVRSGAPFRELAIVPKFTEMDQAYSEKISKIDAWQIELIGMTIIKQIVPNLGNTATAYVRERVLRAKGGLESLSIAQWVIFLVGNAMNVDADEPPFFSKKQAARFTQVMLLPVGSALSLAFSVQAGFLDEGLCLQLSDIAPTEILQEAAVKMGIGIDAIQVPHQYHITLSLDRELSQEQATLVFSLTETSEGVKLSKRTFTIEELEEEFRSAFNAKL